MDRVDRLADDGLIVDLETTGLFPYHGDYILGVAVGGRLVDEQWYFSFRHAEDNLEERQLRDLFNVIAGAGSLGGHNFIRFDLPMMGVDKMWPAHIDPLRWEMPLWDSIVAATLVNENEASFSLDALGQKYLGENADKRRMKDEMFATLRRIVPRVKAERSLMGHLKLLPGRAVADYACADIKDCRGIMRLCEDNLKLWPEMERIAREHYAYVRLLARIQRDGLGIDMDRLQLLSGQVEAAQQRIMEDLRATYGDINFNSPQQIVALCGTENAQADTLALCGHPAAKAITRYKQLGKVLGTYYQGIEKRVDPHGIIHPQLNLTKDPRDRGGTRGTRLSCSDPNFQNLVKRAATEPMLAVRSVVVPKDPGNAIFANDYERAEMWLGAHYSKDAALAEAYHAGRDLYQELADNVTAICRDLGDDTECTRLDGKIGWLAIQYGAGAGKIAEMFGWDYEPRDNFPGAEPGAPWELRSQGWDEYFAQPSAAFKRAFFELCPGIKEQMRAVAQEAEDRRCIQLWSGKWLHFDGWRSRTFTAWNRLIQGGVGEQIRIAMQRLESPLDALGAHMTLQVHDEIVIEGPKEKAQEIKAVVTEIMTDFDFLLKPRVEVNMGDDYHNVARI